MNYLTMLETLIGLYLNCSGISLMRNRFMVEKTILFSSMSKVNMVLSLSIIIIVFNY